MNYIKSIIFVIILFSLGGAICSCGGIYYVRGYYYAIDATKYSEFIFKTSNNTANDAIESDLKKMKKEGNVLKFDRIDSQNITYFKILSPPKDSINLKTLLIYTNPKIEKKVIRITGKPEFLLLCKINGKADTVYYKNGSKILINKFRNRTKKFLGYKFYPY